MKSSRILLPVLLAGAALVPQSAFAQADEVKRGPAPEWAHQSEAMAVPADAAGLVFVRKQDTQVHLDAQGQAEYHAYRIRLLHPNALQLGNLAIEWNPAVGAPVVHAIRIHRGEQTIDVLKDAKFDVLRREGGLEQAMLDGTLTAVLRVPDLRVGDDLEFAFTRRAQDLTLGESSSGVLFLAPNTSPGRFRLALSWIEGQEPATKLSEFMQQHASRGDRTIAMTFENPPLWTPPKDAPPRYALSRVAEYSDFADWQAISRRFAPLYAEAARLDATSPLRAEARRIAAEHADPLARAQAALQMVQQDVRYIYVGLEGGNYRPASAEETWQRRYGDCKGKTVLLLALLGEMGIAAEPVLANNAGLDDALDDHLPMPGMFDHVLVRARIGGKAYFLDGTLPPVAQASRDPVLPYRFVLPVTDPGSAIERLDFRPAAVPDSITLYEIDARAGFDEPAKITQTTIVRGIAGLQQQVQLSAAQPAELTSAFRQQYVGDVWQSVEKASWRFDKAAQASVLTIEGTDTIEWERDDDYRTLSLPGGGFSPPAKRVRGPDQDAGVPYYTSPEFDCRVTTLRLPESTDASDWSYNSQFDQFIFGSAYYRAFDLHGGAIRMVRSMRVEQPEITAALAAKDNARVEDFDNSKANVTYDPDDVTLHSGAAPRVPATYEIDWTAASVPCLAGDGD